MSEHEQAVTAATDEQVNDFRSDWSNLAMQRLIARIDADAKVIAEYERVLGPKLECCGRFAVEHADSLIRGGVLTCPGTGLSVIDPPPEYLEWRKSRRLR